MKGWSLVGYADQRIITVMVQQDTHIDTPANLTAVFQAARDLLTEQNENPNMVLHSWRRIEQTRRPRWSVSFIAD